MTMRIKFWGVRGSLPAPMSPSAFDAQLKDLLGSFLDTKCKTKADIDLFLAALPRHKTSTFGGNTPCVEVKTDSTNVIIDGGSGIRNLGYEFMRGPCGKGAGEVHLLFTHFHWDHLIGLPFFAPLFIPGNVVHVYAVQPELKEVFATLFKKPFFPVALEQLGAKIVYHQLEPRKPIIIGDMTITPYQLDHPDPCWGYRFEHEGKAFAHCVDTECVRVSRKQLGEDLPLYRNADVMVFDAQYTLMETMEKINWGHSSASIGLDLAMREGIKRVFFMHHDPTSSEEKVAFAEAQARHYYQSQLKHSHSPEHPLHHVQWEFAREEMIVEV